MRGVNSRKNIVSNNSDNHEIILNKCENFNCENIKRIGVDEYIIFITL